MFVQMYEGKTITEWALEVKAMQAALATQDQQVQAWRMAYEGLQQQLAAKDQELARVTTLKGHWEELANQYMDRIQAGELQLDTLLGEAVWAMEYLENKYFSDTGCCVTEEQYNRAAAFLARPDVRERQERQKEQP